MQLPKKYNGILPDSSLLITTGVQHGILYHVSDTKVTQVDEILVNNDSYSDNEGFFARSAHGKELGSGAVREKNNEEVNKKFFTILNNHTATLIEKQQPKEIYLFYPSHSKTLASQELTFLSSDLVVHTFEGNYTKHTPLELLEIVFTYKEKKSPKNPGSISTEVKDILETPQPKNL